VQAMGRLVRLTRPRGEHVMHRLRKPLGLSDDPRMPVLSDEASLGLSACFLCNHCVTHGLMTGECVLCAG